MSGLPFFNPWAAPIFAQPKYSDLRRSDNIEDRRKEMFNSLPQAPQAPNVFADNRGMLNLSRHTDFAPVPSENGLSSAAGANTLDALIQQYLAERAPPIQEPTYQPQGGLLDGLIRR